MLNEEDEITIKQQQLRDRVARHREVTANNVCKGNMLNEEDEITIKQQQLRDRVARHREGTSKQSYATSDDMLNKGDESKIKQQQLRERVYKHRMTKKKEATSLSNIPHLKIITILKETKVQHVQWQDIIAKSMVKTVETVRIHF
jgi:hypothetical protein